MKKILMISCILILASFHARAAENDSLIQAARDHLAGMKYSEALKTLKPLEEADSLNPEVLYIKAEVYLVYGMDKFRAYMEKLSHTGNREYYDILKLKHLLFIGSSEFDDLLPEALGKYPENPELQFCKWLNELTRGDYEGCRRSAGTVSSLMLMKCMPYLALYYHSWDHDHNLALQYLDTLESMAGEFYGSRDREVLNLLSGHNTIPSEDSLIELPFSWCGPGMGFYLLDEKGDSVKIEIDTGTGYGLMTIHDLEKGESIYGKDVLTIPDGIQYNYMKNPEDLHYKISKLSLPDYGQLIFGYFNGQFTKADGCSSPFVFKGHALHMDPVNEKVWLRSRENMENYISMNREKLDIIPYELRNGWIYIPCRINGREVKMMIETGSRDINFNPLSADYLGLKPYESTLMWNGEDYPVNKIDCSIEIGRTSYEVKGGLISDFVLGNWYYGVGSAGDIGPDFLRKHAFIIDPFDHRFILINED